MADNITAKANTGTGVEVLATDDIGGVHYPRTKLSIGADGAAADVHNGNPLPVAFPSAQSVNVGNFPASQAVTGTFWQATQPVSGPLTDTQLRATPVPVSGTFWQATQPVSGPLTDTQLRATAVPVSGPLTDTQLRATAVPVSGTFFQATQPVSLVSQPLPTGASTETTLAALNTKTPALGQAAMAASQPVVIASDQSAVPITKVDAAASGTITAINGAVSVSCAGKGTVTIQTEGTYTATGGLTPQARVGAAATWVTLSGASTLLSNTGTYSATIASAAQGIYQIDVSGFVEFRIIALGAVTGTATVNVRATDAVALTALDQSLPAGTAIIGALSANQTVNCAQMNGVAVTMGDGATGTGVQRVTQASAARTASLTRTSASSSVAAGARSVGFLNVGAANATVAGAALSPGESVSFVAPMYDTLTAISYVGTGTNLLITVVS